jgi:predicted membrane protein
MNKHIIAATLIIGASGVVNAWQNKKAITPVIMGSYVFMLVLSIIDLFGGEASRVAGAIAMVAVVAVILNTWTPLLSTITKAVGGK